MTERFQKAYDSLVRAFFEGTLAKWTCTACACGNIILDAVGTPLTKEQFNDDLYRMSIDSLVDIDKVRIERATTLSEFSNNLWANKRVVSDGDYVALEPYKHEINAAGYTAEEFARIENAFENNTVIKIGRYPQFREESILEDQYKGLCAVVDVLLELDDEKEDPDELKQKFREHPKLATA